LSRRKILLAAALGLLAICLVGAPAAYAIDFEPQSPHSPNAETIRSAYWVMFVIVVVLIVLINAALIAAVIRFRARRGREPARLTAARGALRPPLAALALMAIVLFVYGVVRTEDARTLEPSGADGLQSGQTAQVGIKDAPPISPAPDTDTGAPAGGSDVALTSPLQINAIAQQWLWRFEYPGHTPTDPLFAYGELVVPVDTTVILNITSTDVLHSWWVPSLGGQVQASPGETVQTWFKADAVGRYAGTSTLFSGSSFPAMRSWVRVVTVPEYQTYIEDLRKELAAAQDFVGQRQAEETTPPSDTSTGGSG
jgi:cytochrome c oxidase subunit 2